MNHNHSLNQYSQLLLFLATGASVFAVGTVCYYLLPSALAKTVFPLLSGLFTLFFFRWQEQKNHAELAVSFSIKFTTYLIGAVLALVVKLIILPH